ncbi:MAG TPA: hypothetical protein VIK97_15455 [Casimicrobiaceae bacterium]
MPIRWRLLVLLLAVLTLAGGCATPAQPPTWQNPAYAGRPFNRIFVIGLSSKSLRDRQTFEDLMVARLQAGGAQAVPGWQYLPQDRPADPAAVRAAVAQAGADAVLLARFMGFDTQSAVVAPGVGLYGMYAGWYGAPDVVQYQVATVYTTLYDVSSLDQVWTYNPQTFDPTTLQQQMPVYVNSVVGLLQSSGLLVLH